jgi:hypothetical protein
MPEELPKNPKKDIDNEDETSISESLKKSLDSEKKIEDVSYSHASLVKKISDGEKAINASLTERATIAEDLKESLKDSQDSIKSILETSQKNIGESVIKPTLQEPQKETAPEIAPTTNPTLVKEKSVEKEKPKEIVKQAKTIEPITKKSKADSENLTILEKISKLMKSMTTSSEKSEKGKSQQIKSNSEETIKQSEVVKNLIKSVDEESKLRQKNTSQITESKINLNEITKQNEKNVSQISTEVNLKEKLKDSLKDQSNSEKQSQVTNIVNSSVNQQNLKTQQDLVKEKESLLSVENKIKNTVKETSDVKKKSNEKNVNNTNVNEKSVEKESKSEPKNQEKKSPQQKQKTNALKVKPQTQKINVEYKTDSKSLDKQLNTVNKTVSAIENISKEKYKESDISKNIVQNTLDESKALDKVKQETTDISSKSSEILKQKENNVNKNQEIVSSEKTIVDNLKSQIDSKKELNAQNIDESQINKENITSQKTSFNTEQSHLTIEQQIAVAKEKYTENLKKAKSEQSKISEKSIEEQTSIEETKTQEAPKKSKPSTQTIKIKFETDSKQLSKDLVTLTNIRKETEKILNREKETSLVLDKIIKKQSIELNLIKQLSVETKKVSFDSIIKQSSKIIDSVKKIKTEISTIKKSQIEKSSEVNTSVKGEQIEKQVVKPKKAEKQESLKPITQEVNVKTNVNTGGLEKELSLINQIISDSEKFETQKSEQIQSTLQSRTKELSINSELVKSTEKQSQALQKSENIVSNSVKQLQEESNTIDKVSQTTSQISEKAQQTSKSINDTVTNKNKELSVTKQIAVESLKINESKSTVEEVPIITSKPETVSKKASKATSKKSESIEEVPIMKSETVSKKATKKSAPKKAQKPVKEGESVMAMSAPKMVLDTKSKTEAAQKKINDQIKTTESTENSLVNVSSAYYRQQLKKQEEQNKINESKTEELSIEKATTQTAKAPQIQKAVAPSTPPPPPPPPNGPNDGSKTANAGKQAAIDAQKILATKKEEDTIEKNMNSTIKENVDHTIQKVSMEEHSLSNARLIQEAARSTEKREGDTQILTKQNIKLLDTAINRRETVDSLIDSARNALEDMESVDKEISKTTQLRIFAENRLQQFKKTSTIDEAQILTTQKEIEKATRDEALSRKSLNEAIEKGTTLSGQEAIIHEEYIKDMQKIYNASSAHLAVLQDSLSYEEAEYLALKETIAQHRKIEQSLNAQKNHQKDMNDRMGIFGKSIKVVGGILDHYGVGQFMKINDAIDAMRKKAEAGGNKIQVALSGLKSIGSTLGKMLMDPVALITGAVTAFAFLIKSAVEYQAKTFEAAKNLGSNLEYAQKLRDQFEGIATANGKLGLTSKELLETQVKMNEELGFMAPETDEMVQSSTLIMRRFGASAESMAEMQVQAAKNGQTQMQTFQTVVGTGKAMAARLKMGMTEKQILDAVSKVSSSVYMNFKGNLKTITESVVQAQKMGLSLDKINSIGEGMLDFENSISKEMEAQLLTGKNIDLSRARQFALAGDTKGLMEELNKTIGSQAEYEEMNVIQRQAYAEALGMTKDQMDDMYRQQEKAALLGPLANKSEAEQYNALVAKKLSYEEISKIMGESSVKSAMEASVQEKMSATMGRINEAIGKASAKLLPIIEKVANWLSDSKKLEHVIESIGDGAAFIAENFGTILKVAGAFWIGSKVYRAAESIFQAQRLKDQMRLQMSQTQSLQDISKQLAVQNETNISKTQQVNSQVVSNQQQQQLNDKKIQQNIQEDQTIGKKLEENTLTQNQVIKETQIEGTKVAQTVTDGERNIVKEAEVGMLAGQSTTEGIIEGQKVAQTVTDGERNMVKEAEVGMLAGQEVAETTIEGQKVAQTVTDGERNIVKEAEVGILATQSGTEGIIEGQKVAQLTTGQTQQVVEGKTSVIKKAQLGLERLFGFKKKENLITTQTANTTEKLINTTKKAQIIITEAGTVAEEAKAVATQATAVGAVTAGSGYLGPGALAVGAAALAFLAPLLMGMGGGSSEADIPELEAPSGESPSVEPLNAAAETSKAINHSLTRGKEDVERSSAPIKLTVVNNMDAQTGKGTVQVLNDNSTYPDSTKMFYKT